MIDYEWGNELMNYPSTYAYYNGGEEPELPEGYTDYEKKIALDSQSCFRWKITGTICSVK